MTVFEAYITNLGKYAEGQLVGETLKFPATTEEVQSLLKNIGVDGVRYPKLNIREQMAAYKEIIDRSSLEGERLHPRKEHDDR